MAGERRYWAGSPGRLLLDVLDLEYTTGYNLSLMDVLDARLGSGADDHVDGDGDAIMTVMMPRIMIIIR